MGQPKRRNVEGECNDQRKQYRLWDKYHCRGANVGTIDGNTKVAIKQLNGTLTNYYGGGVGSSATNAANVTGNVETTIATKNANFRLGTFVGGVQYGTIDGRINSTVSGSGGWTGTANRFIGGSYYGNIGSEPAKDAIVTNLDSSLYSTGRATFEGGNRYSGTINGNIVNTVKAGPSASVGGIGDFNGGGGNNVSTLSQSSMGASNTTTYDNYTPAQRAQLAEAGASFKVYGNITSHLVSGSFQMVQHILQLQVAAVILMGIPRLKWGRLQQMAVQVETVLLIKDQNRPTLLIPQQPKIEGNYLAGILSAVGRSGNYLEYLHQREY